MRQQPIFLALLFALSLCSSAQAQTRLFSPHFNSHSVVSATVTILDVAPNLASIDNATARAHIPGATLYAPVALTATQETGFTQYEVTWPDQIADHINGTTTIFSYDRIGVEAGYELFFSTKAEVQQQVTGLPVDDFIDLLVDAIGGQVATASQLNNATEYLTIQVDGVTAHINSATVGLTELAETTLQRVSHLVGVANQAAHMTLETTGYMMSSNMTRNATEWTLAPSPAFVRSASTQDLSHKIYASRYYDVVTDATRDNFLAVIFDYNTFGNRFIQKQWVVEGFETEAGLLTWLEPRIQPFGAGSPWFVQD